MKKMLLLTSVLLALTATVALAGGVNFNWGTVCYTEAPSARTCFNCNTNAGQWSMVSSFMVDQEVSDMVGFELTMIGQSNSALMPDWWRMGAPPDCRAGYARFSADFSTAPQTRCLDWEGGQAIAAYIPSSYAWSGNQATIRTGAAIDARTPFDLQPGVEYYAGRFTILNGKTVGAGSCSGCGNGMMWCVPLITAAGLGGKRVDLTWPLQGGNNCLYFNVYGDPARNTTWGQIKSLYR